MTKKDRIVALKVRGFSHSLIAERCACGIAYVRAALQRNGYGGSRPCDLEGSRRRYWTQKKQKRIDRRRRAA